MEEIPRRPREGGGVDARRCGKGCFQKLNYQNVAEWLIRTRDFFGNGKSFGEGDVRGCWESNAARPESMVFTLVLLGKAPRNPKTSRQWSKEDTERARLTLLELW